MNISRRNTRNAKPNFSIATKKKRKVLRGNFQTFDQKGMFDTIEESPANILAVITGHDPLTARAISAGLPGGMREYPVSLRNISSDSQVSSRNTNMKSAFVRKLEDVVSASNAHRLPPIGSLVELEATIIGGPDTTLFPWSYKLLSRRLDYTELLPMPEVLTALIGSKMDTETNVRSYRVAMAVRGEKEPITSFMDELPRLKRYLGYKEDMLNGFLLIGKRNPKSREYHGFSCYRTQQDNENNLTDDQVLLNFLKHNSHKFLEAMTPENPWFLVPLYMLPCSHQIGEHVQHIAVKNEDYISYEANPYEMNFVHANIVLSYKSSATQPSVVHFKKSRSKPILLDAAIPARAKEKSIKAKVERAESEEVDKMSAEHVFANFS